jgi:hypothetical protein
MHGRTLFRLIKIYISLAILAVSMVCCGVESVSYYSPPSFTYGGNVITLTHNTVNTESFLGYDIYYRVYNDDNTAQADRTFIENASNSANSTPESVLGQVTSRGFKKMYLAAIPATAPTPLLSIASPTTAVTFTIQMPQSTQFTNWYFTKSTDASLVPTEIIRCINSIGSNSFNSLYNPGDSDYAASIQAGDGTQVYMVAFAVAYGYDLTNLVSIFSFPASLYSEIKYSIPSALGS